MNLHQNPDLYLKLANGQILKECHAGEANGMLWLFLKMPMREAVNVVLNEEALRTIEYHFGSLYNEYKGYTELDVIANRKDHIEVRLTGEAVAKKENVVYEDDSDGNGTDVVSE